MEKIFDIIINENNEKVLKQNYINEGEPQPNWIDHEKKTIVNDDYDEASLYSFNYHRSAGSFDSMQKTEVIHNSYNPDKNQLYTNVLREEFIKLSDNE